MPRPTKTQFPKLTGRYPVTGQEVRTAGRDLQTDGNERDTMLLWSVADVIQFGGYLRFSPSGLARIQEVIWAWRMLNPTKATNYDSWRIKANEIDLFMEPNWPKGDFGDVPQE